MDEDLAAMSREHLIDKVKRLRAAIRAHRDSTGHDLCWHHPQLWSLLPEKIEPAIAVAASNGSATVRGRFRIAST